MFTADSVAIPIGHGDGPAIGFGMKNLIRRRQRFRRGLLHGLREVAVLQRVGWNCGRTLGLTSCWRIRGSGGKLRKLWRRWRGGGDGDERHLADEIVAGVQL